VLPDDCVVDERRARSELAWRRDGVAMEARSRSCSALNELYGRPDQTRQGYGGPPKLQAEGGRLHYELGHQRWRDRCVRFIRSSASAVRAACRG